MNINQKTTPSQDLSISWLAGIIDGEGSISCHQLKSQKTRILGVVIVNTDRWILSEIERIYKKYGIFYSKYNRTLYNKNYSFKSNKPCFEIVVRRKEDSLKLCNLIIPYLIGMKKQRAILLKKFIDLNPKKTKNIYQCAFCKQTFTGRKKQYCSLRCWHEFAIGQKNPNYRHGKYLN